MPFPSPSRLERFLRPYESAHGLPLRVWGAEVLGVGLDPARTPTMETELFGHPPRLVLLGAGDDGLALVRQTHDGMEDLDGVIVPWGSVRRLERDPHLMRDLIRVEIAGRAPHLVAVSNHVLLPHNRATAKTLCDLLRSSRPDPSVTHPWETHTGSPEAHPV